MNISYKTADIFKYETTTKVVDREKLNQKATYLSIKQVLDRILSLVGLIILLPVFLIVALAIKIDDPSGSVFFVQNRIGKNGNPFKIYKFRTMVADAEERLEALRQYNEIEGLMFKMKDDPRITRVGKILRKYSIDELPQFINVLKGDMSLIGPRPPLVSEFADYNNYHKQRLMVKPGCSGLWQVTGRNDVSFEEMVSMDLKYIESICFLNDLLILFKTVYIMIIPNNAA